MTVHIEKDGPVWTVIHSRPEARGAMDPESATALYEAFQAFDADESASVVVFWGEGGALLRWLVSETCRIACRGRSARPVRFS